MSKPVAIRKIIVEFNINNLSILQDALTNYHKYLEEALKSKFPHVLSKSAIKRRIRYIEDFIENLEVNHE